MENVPSSRVTGPHSCSGGCIAFFGGSFDPPHLGHLAIARAARTALNLDRVLFAPVGAQPLKPKGSTASFADRLAMTELAIAGEPGFEISLADAPNAAGQPNYTLETLRTLRAGLPPDGRLYCLMGADSFASLRRWHGAAEIPFAASLIVASRPGQNLDDLARFLPPGLTFDHPSDPVIPADAVILTLSAAKRTDPLLAAPKPAAAPRVDCRCYIIRNSVGNSARFYVLPDLDVEISASEIRAQVRSSSPDSAPAGSLPPRVAAYIREHGLYR